MCIRDRNIGVDALKEAVSSDCITQAGDILESSARLKLHDIVISALSQITLYRTALSMPADEFDKRFSDIKTFFGHIQKQTADMPEAEKNNKLIAKAHLNDVKNSLAEKVRELFGIEYHYDINDIEEASLGEGENGQLEFQVKSVCDSLNETLNTIFMHREENAYKVVRRINDLNRLVRKLVKMRDDK